MQITVDPGNALGDTTPADNTTTINFTAIAPFTLTNKFIWPLAGTQSQDWTIVNYVDANPLGGQAADFNGGPFTYDGHDAMDITLPNFAKMDAGLQVMAAAAGVVSQVQDGNFDRNVSGGGSANFVAIDHPNGWRTYYYHLSANTITVKVGDTVAAGHVLGLAGSSGNSTLAHLHFAVYHNGNKVETNYAPASYWQQTVPYQDTVPLAAMDSGLSADSLDHQNQPVQAYWDALSPPGADSTLKDLAAEERPVSISTIPTSFTGGVWAWDNPSNFHVGEAYTINWLRPDETVAATGTFTIPLTGSGGAAAWYYAGPWSSYPGTWAFQLVKDGVEVVRKAFVVTSGAAPATLRVTQSGTYLPNGRTTPIDFGTTPAGSPNFGTFTLNQPGLFAADVGQHFHAPGIFRGRCSSCLDCGREAGPLS